MSDAESWAGMANVCARIPTGEKREFQKRCIDEGVDMQDQIRKLIREWMRV